VKVFFLYTILGIAIVVGQTTIIRLLFFQDILYDLLVPLTVFARLNLSGRQAGVLVAIIGLLMDLFSGGIFGVYLTVYFWIFLLVRGISNYFEVKGTVFRAVLVGLCVLAENLILFMFGTTHLSGSELLTSRIGAVMGQTVLGAATGPAVLAILEKIYEGLQAPAWGRNTKRQNLGM
jgi:cell shape-determining protein MreD